MAERAGSSLEAAVELRYDLLCKGVEMVEKPRATTTEATTSHEPETESDNGIGNASDGAECESKGGIGNASDGVASETASAELAQRRSELAVFNGGPPGRFAPGSAERTAWFREWLSSHDVESALDPSKMSRNQVLSLLAQDPDMLETAKARGLIGQDAMRVVQVASLEQLKPAVEIHPVLKWDDWLNQICGQQGRVLQDDPSDGTSQVQFPAPLTATAWLPTSALIDPSACESMVRVAQETDLRPAVEAHDALKWHDKMSNLCGQRGRVLQVDSSDGTSRVFFPAPLSITAWLPTAALTSDEGRSVRAPAVEQLRPVMEAHTALKWNDRLESICGQRGRVLQDDPDDGTSQVDFPAPIGIKAWLPTSVLLKDDDDAKEAENRPGAEEGEDGGEPDDEAYLRVGS